jgi:hypothetical protein
VIEIDGGTVRPKRGTELLPGHQIPLALEQSYQEKEGLALKIEANASFPELSRVEIDLENPEAHEAHRWRESTHSVSCSAATRKVESVTVPNRRWDEREL